MEAFIILATERYAEIPLKCLRCEITKPAIAGEAKSAIILLKAKTLCTVISSSPGLSPRWKRRWASGYKLFTVSTRMPCICHPRPRWVLRYCYVFLRVSLRLGRHAIPNISSLETQKLVGTNLNIIYKTGRLFSFFNILVQRKDPLNFIRSKRSHGKSWGAIR